MLEIFRMVARLRPIDIIFFGDEVILIRQDGVIKSPVFGESLRSLFRVIAAKREDGGAE